MADQESCMDVQLLKSTKITVFVDEALPDILVVTYEFGVKIFKGVLLDSTKRNLPCGIPNVNPTFNIHKKNPDDDTLYSVNQRFAYTDPNNTRSKNIHISSKYKNSKMTVRLRPRQVLCSKCKGICNENSENVSRKRKTSESVQPAPIKRSANAPITRSVNSVLNKKKTNIENKQIEVPKVSLDVTSALSGNVNKLNIDNNSTKRLISTVPIINKTVSTIHNVVCNNEQLDDDSTHSFEHSDCSSITVSNQDQSQQIRESEILTKSGKRILRKKRSVGSMEDLWDESVFEEASKNNNTNAQNNANAEQPLANTCGNTRTIKISYGPQGEGTVLKIPAVLENLNVSDDSEENINVDDPKNKLKEETNKAARKALKKAKKEARKKVLISGLSPTYIGSVSPRYSIGGSSPRYTVGSASPRHGLGNNSPRYVTSTSFDINASRRRKHKMKHKKRHREEKDRKHRDGEVSAIQDEAIKEQVITQKLSINLKRLNNTYLSCSAENEDSGSEDLNDQVPNFPPLNSPLVLRLNAQTISSALGANGCRLLVGDVVWGKIHGFPWWPGKILTITTGDNNGPQAHISWYGSPTSSLIQCDQLSSYLDNFKVRYNRKKRGPYKEAIKQATTDARANSEKRLRESIVGSPARSIITVVPPALASPREIDVVS